jgi:hypothetical protein
MTQRTFPRNGFLLLGLLSVAAAIAFIGRAWAVDPTMERIVSAVLFGGFGVLWIIAYWSDR